jgi:stage II sporulation protein D
VIVAYFHSTSGGHTENNENIFGGSPLPYIRGVRDPWDRHSPYHRWRLSYSARSLGNALGVGRLRRVTVNKRGVSGRIVFATFRGSGGRDRLHGWNDIRSRLTLRDAPSTFKKITSRRSTASAAVAGLGSRAVARDIFGTVAPGGKGDAITLQRETADGWKQVAESRLGNAGKYRFAVENAGTYRVVSAGDPGPPVRIR